MAIRSKNKVSAEFNMSSMTDIVFLLLIFFMITSTMIHPNALELSLPKSSNQTSEKPLTSVSITKDLQFAVERDFVSFEEIEPLLKQKLSGNDKPSVALHVEKSVPMEEVVKIMNIAKNNKWKLILATKP